MDPAGDGPWSQQVMGNGGRKGRLVPNEFIALNFASEKKIKMYKHIRSNLWNQQFENNVESLRLFIPVYTGQF